MESAVVGYDSEKKLWELWTMDDEERAELPLDSRGNETFPIGVALDLVATEKDQLPLLLVLSNDGLLCPFQINYKGPHSKEPVCKPREKNVVLSDVKISHAFAARSSDFFGTAMKISQNSACAVEEPTMASTLQPPTSRADSVSTKDTIVPTAQVADIDRKKTVEFSQQSPDVLKYDTTAEPQKVADTKEAKLNVLRGEIMKIISQFENGTEQLKASLSQPLEKKANMEVDLQKISQSIQNTDVNIKKNKEITEHLDIASVELHRQMINEKSSLDMCQSSFQKRSSVQEQILLKERPLTSQQEKFLNDINKRIECTDQALNDLSEKFSALLSSILEEKFEKRKPNGNDLIYRTLTNMQSIIVVQKGKINELKNSSKFLRKPNPNPQQSNITSGRLSTVESSKSLYRESKPIIIARDTPLKRFLMTRNRVPVRMTAPTSQTLNASKSLEILAALKKMDEERAEMALMAKTKKISIAEKVFEPEMKKPEFEPVPLKPEKIETIRKPAQIKSPALPSNDTAVPVLKMEQTAPKVAEVLKIATPINTYASLSPVQQQKAVSSQISNSVAPISALNSTALNIKSTNTMPTIFNLTSNLNIFKPSATTAFTAKSLTSPALTVNSTPSIFEQKVLTDSTKKFDVNDTKKEVRDQPAVAEAAVTQENRVETISDQSSTIFKEKSVAHVSKIAENIGEITHKLTSTELESAPSVSVIPARETTPQIIDITNQETPTSNAEERNSLRTLSTLIESLNKEDEKQEIITKEEIPKASDAITPIVELSKQTELPPARPADQSVATLNESKVIAATVSMVTTVTSIESTLTSTTTVKPTVSTCSTVAVSPPQQPLIQKVDNNVKLDEGDMEAENVKQDTTNTVDFSFNICKPSDDGGGFFGGLGGTPKPESANKNVFGTVRLGHSATPTTSATPSIFGSPCAQAKSSPFGSASATTTTCSAFGSLSPFGKPAGSPFSSSSGGTVAQQGFGNLGSSPVAAVASSGFGSPATFGGSPIFGSKSIFGSGGNSSSLPASGSIFGGGGGAKFGSSAVFGGSPSSATQPTAMGAGSTATSQTIFGGGGGGFAAFANTNAPTFGSLANAPAGSGSQMFGGGGSIFGGAASNLSQSQKPPTVAAPSFSQWRG
uniref:Nuclear pore complex protein Nup214 n=1 Tax=Romanomermis culicivorax TaxID=13658 RepID=A0A915KPH7_ROMCU